MIIQLITYVCDIKNCETPRVHDERVIQMQESSAKPCVPRGWRYVENAGMICDRCNEELGVITRKFFTEPGHE